MLPNISPNTRAYSNLKKLIYAIEKATLGLAPFPKSHLDLYPNENADSSAADHGDSSEPEMNVDSTSSPLLRNRSLRSEPEGLGLNTADIPAAADALFSQALSDQLKKIIHFYNFKELELFNAADHFLTEVNFVETHEISQRNVLRHHRRMSGIIYSFLAQSTHASAFHDEENPTVSPIRSPVSPHRPNPSSSSDVMPLHSAFIWASKSLKTKKKQLVSTAVSLYVSLSNLRNYVDLNLTGFGKILKKYDKVTGHKLKRSYMMNHVEIAYPFLEETRHILGDKINKIVQAYARMATDSKVDLALHELDSHLREQIVWERNTIWRDMIEQERRTAAIGVRRQLKREGHLTDTHHAILDSPSRPFRVCGFKLFEAPWYINRTSILSVLSCIVFIVLINTHIFPKVEQNHCFAILVFASLLWAFELLPLFVTSLLIPFLVVTLRVLVGPVSVSSHAKHAAMVFENLDDAFTLPFLDNTNSTLPVMGRLGAKDAAKRIFSDMFSPVIMLLLGGFSLAAALSKHHIAKAMASSVLASAGSKPHMVLLANMFVSTFASMWISNVAAPVLCFELPILRNLPHKSPYARCLILGIAMAANVDNMNPSPGWLEWFAIVLPVCLLTDVLIWALLLFVYKPAHAATAAPPEIFHYSHHRESVGSDNASSPASSHRRQGSMRVSGQSNLYGTEPSHTWSPLQWYILAVSGLTITLWCLEKRFEWFFGDMGVIAILPMVAFFGTGVLTKEDFNNFLWTVIMLAMGGISLGKAVESSGLLQEITHTYMLPMMSGLSTFKCFLLITGLVLVATTFISHTVGALIILPVVKEVGKSLPDPVSRTLVMGAALMCSGAMGLPVSSFPNMNAISLEDPTGVPWLTVQDFLQVGLISSFISYLCVNMMAYPIMVFMQFG